MGATVCACWMLLLDALAVCACWTVPSGGVFLRLIVPIAAVAPAEEARLQGGHANNGTHYSPPFLQSLKGDALCLAQGLM